MYETIYALADVSQSLPMPHKNFSVVTSLIQETTDL
uniref:Uncharacterized protein n=1 Tax=Myoviridae sp. ctiu99 TaxID=2825158 RepID=A0A8S5NVN7_9CAUD|nr:MAG TPA: hypothetical protein [Myoviridae sp. ctiu99]